jgi:hypothetical protein
MPLHFYFATKVAVVQKMELKRCVVLFVLSFCVARVSLSVRELHGSSTNSYKDFMKEVSKAEDRYAHELSAICSKYAPSTQRTANTFERVWSSVVIGVMDNAAQHKVGQPVPSIALIPASRKQLYLPRFPGPFLHNYFSSSPYCTTSFSKW